jgi:hypothetical protein
LENRTSKIRRRNRPGDWREPFVSHEVILSLIHATANRKGLKVKAALDTNKYPKGINMTDTRVVALNLSREGFHGEWNYTLKLRKFD